MQQASRHWGIAAILAAAVLWGTTGTVQSFLPEDRAPLAIGALRLLIGAAALLAFALSRPESRRGFGALPWRPILLAGLAIGGYNLLFFWAVSEAGVGIGTAIAIGSAPLWASGFEILGRGLWPDRLRMRGQAVSILGVGLLALAGQEAQGSPFGMGLAAAGGACYAAYSLLTSGIGQRVPPATIAAATFSVAAAMTAPVLFLVPLDWLAAPRDWLAIAYLGIGATAVTYALYTWGLRHVAASTAVTLALAEPVTAWLLASFVVGEAVTGAKLAGALLVLTGLAIVTLFPRAMPAGEARLQSARQPISRR